MDKIKENFELYVSRKLIKDNDYRLWDPEIGGMVSTNMIPYTEDELEQFVKHKPLYSETTIQRLRDNAEPGTIISIPHVSLLKKEFINKLHPDNLDSREFWEEATNNFPYYSIAGGDAGCKSPEECNEVNLKMAKNIGAIPYLDRAIDSFSEYISSPSVLEIGPGYGNVCFYLQEKYPRVDYYGIDVNPLFEWPTLYQTDGSTINKEVPNNLDIVYSHNVFQHLSKSQRSSYYKEIYDKLKPGGVFLFGMFVLTDENKDWPCWGMKDYKGRYYTGFFKQYTEVDHIDELKAEVEGLGFHFLNTSWHEDKINALTFQLQKPAY